MQEFVDRTVDFLGALPKFEFIDLVLDHDTAADLEILTEALPVRGVVVVYSSPTDGSTLTKAVSLHWEPTQNGFEIKDIQGISAGTELTMRLLVLG
jgi:hypothetical protein